LRGMSERVRQLRGALDMSSTQQGTTVTATIPLPQASSDSQQEK
jgi:signal transduction histidine kinase